MIDRHTSLYIVLIKILLLSANEEWFEYYSMYLTIIGLLLRHYLILCKYLHIFELALNVPSFSSIKE